jgi:GT2 family glycosyltransferase
MSEISVVVITRNRRTLLCQALERIRALLPQAEIIVVDNASTDDTAEHVRRHFPDVKLVPLAHNVGIPHARNIGARHAQASLLLFLDDDGFLHCPHLPQLIETFQKNPQWAVLSFPVVSPRDSTPADSSAGSAEASVLKHADLPPTPFPKGKGNSPPSLGEGPGERSDALASGSQGYLQTPLSLWYTFNGGAALVKREIFWEVGGFPEHFFYSHEEDDLSLRLFARGYRVVICPWARFRHVEAGHKKIFPRIFYYYRNRQWVIWRHLPLGWAIVESLATLVGGVVRTAFTPALAAVLAGTVAAFVRLPLVLSRERHSLSSAQYAQYRALSAGRANLFVRMKYLWHAVHSGRRLSGIT